MFFNLCAFLFSLLVLLLLLMMLMLMVDEFVDGSSIVFEFLLIEVKNFEFNFNLLTLYGIELLEHGILILEQS